MSGKLDQSLDQIMQDTKPAGGRGRTSRKPRLPRRAKTTAKAAIAAPAGGVSKARAAPKGPRATMQAPVGPATGDSKIVVSNLPEDVTETQIKDYFGQTVGSIKKVLLQYGPTGRSRGIATIIFGKPDAGAEAARKLDGVKVDNKPMRIEILLGAKQAPVPKPAKGLADRVSQPKSAIRESRKEKEKPKTNGAAKTNGASKANTGGRDRKSGRSGKPKKKTAEELDAEMMDYFGNESGAVNGTAQPAVAATNGADTGMVDEVM